MITPLGLLSDYRAVAEARKVLDGQADSRRLCGSCQRGSVWEACYCVQLWAARVLGVG